MITGLNEVKGNINTIFKRKLFATESLCRWYAEKAKQIFRERQFSNEFWNNQTGIAYNQVFSKEFVEFDAIGWFMAHAVDYGVYLELANDRKHEALRPIVFELFPEFDKALKEIWE